MREYQKEEEVQTGISEILPGLRDFRPGGGHQKKSPSLPLHMCAATAYKTMCVYVFDSALPVLRAQPSITRSVRVRGHPGRCAGRMQCVYHIA